MDVATKACNVCDRIKQDTNHWVVAIVRPGYEGIIFVPAEAAQDPRVEGYEYEDLCGQNCAHKRLSQWFGELRNVIYPTKGDAK
jgi:hypothetical protein